MENFVEGYALVTAKGHYLSLEQVASHDIEVLTFSNPDMATLHKLGVAIQTKQEIIDNNGYWNYSILEEQIPVGIVKIKKIIKVEEVAE
ncbi:hypothetical protein X915_gp085 [Bacillus phage vB_BanS-Tsamsa]|uniref:Uncharacterized protein n=1 Tax=Bacillus phage vB_BanS-Tsamsa TaxID=1308863 RepID=U5J9R6_9CAUD|nr:hypothetical protein X915_gp085 [Bacillus phage vB_BanS-Tsamsa]AGI11896.1 hypothetical protein [Bacillus phage vB_BanS-Tsamsa]